MLIIMLFLSEFLIGSIAFIFRGGLSRTLANELRFGIEQHYNASDRGSLIAPSVATIWDNVQTSVSCTHANFILHFSHHFPKLEVTPSGFEDFQNNRLKAW